MTYFPWLYQKEGRDVHMWWVCPEEGQLKITYGTIGKFHKTIYKKNQGEKEASRMFREKVDKGYLMATELKDKLELRPMLMNSYKYYSFALEGTVCFQPKVRGEHMLVGMSGGHVVSFDKEGKEREAPRVELEEGEFLDVCFHEGVYYAFDYFKLTQLDAPLTQRYHELILKKLPSNIKVVELVMKDKRETDNLFETYVGQGHAGIVLKHPKGKYLLNRRSFHCLQKRKEETMEVEIVGVERDEDGTPIWLCEDDDLNEYMVKSVNCRWEDRGAMIGTKLTIPKK